MDANKILLDVNMAKIGLGFILRAIEKENPSDEIIEALNEIKDFLTQALEELENGE